METRLYIDYIQWLEGIGLSSKRAYVTVGPPLPGDWPNIEYRGMFKIYDLKTNVFEREASMIQYVMSARRNRFAELVAIYDYGIHSGLGWRVGEGPNYQTSNPHFESHLWYQNPDSTYWKVDHPQKNTGPLEFYFEPWNDHP